MKVGTILLGWNDANFTLLVRGFSPSSSHININEYTSQNNPSFIIC